MPIIRNYFKGEEPSLSSVLSLKLPVEKADVPIENPISLHGDVREYTLYNQKMSVVLISYGAAIREIFMCDKAGKTRDVVLGYDTWEEYKSDTFYIGVVCGPLTNRTSNAQFNVLNDTVKLEANDGKNHLHGGKAGCAKNLWSGHVIEKSVVFEFVYPCKSAGGKLADSELCMRCAYTLTDDDDLVIQYQGFLKGQKEPPEKPVLKQPINLTNHSYFNLGGHMSGDIYSHWLKVEADDYTPLNEEHLPTGEIKPVSSCSQVDLDFTKYKHLNTTVVSDPKRWYDKNVILRTSGDKREVKFDCDQLKLAASVYEADSGIELKCYTDQPCLMLYTANYLSEASGKKGHVYQAHHGLCLEAQNYVDGVNQASYPAEGTDIFLDSGDLYIQRTVYSFGTDDDGPAARQE